MCFILKCKTFIKPRSTRWHYLFITDTIIHLHVILVQRWSMKICLLLVSAAPSLEDPGGLGSGGADAGLQLGDQRAAQDIAEDPEKQPCESLKMYILQSAYFTEHSQTIHVRCPYRDSVIKIYLVQTVSITTVIRNI